MYFLFALFSDKPEVFLPEYTQPAILHAAHFRTVVNCRFIIVIVFVLSYVKITIGVDSFPFSHVFIFVVR